MLPRVQQVGSEEVVQRVHCEIDIRARNLQVLEMLRNTVRIAVTEPLPPGPGLRSSVDPPVCVLCPR